MNKSVKNRKSEYGGAGAKFLFIIAIIFLVVHAGYNLIPVAYDGEKFKQEMQTAVIQGTVLPTYGNLSDKMKSKILAIGRDCNIPENAFIDIKVNKNVVQARVAYTKQVPVLPFGAYDYVYEFDHTAIPTGYSIK